MIKTYTQFIEDNADEGGDHLAVRGHAFSAGNGGYCRLTEEPRPNPYDQVNYWEFLSGTD